MSLDLARHEAECSACRALAERLRRVEERIARALRFEPAAAGGAGQRLSHATNRRLAPIGLAAALVVGVSAFWLAAGASRPASTERIAASVLEHWNDEPESWTVTSATLETHVLDRVLAGRATIDVTRLGGVSYAKSCRVAGWWMSHLVVQTESGPLMVLLMPGQRVDREIVLEVPEHGLGGVLRPHGRGSVAVLGPAPGSLAPIERRIRSAIDI